MTIGELRKALLGVFDECPVELQMNDEYQEPLESVDIVSKPGTIILHG